VSRDTFEAAAQVAQVRRGSRNEPGPNTAHRHTRHGYLLRSYVHCGDCGHRMFGKTRHGHAYYSCYPAGNNADRLGRYPADHPKAVYVREDSLTEALDHVIATRVFGPDRMAFLRHALAQRPSRQRHIEAARVEALREQIDDLASRQDRLIAELETTDPADRAFRDRLRRRFDTLETERTDKTAQLAELEKILASQPKPDVDLLDALPISQDRQHHRGARAPPTQALRGPPTPDPLRPPRPRPLPPHRHRRHRRHRRRTDPGHDGHRRPTARNACPRDCCPAGGTTSHQKQQSPELR
jgi:hypothetical protein